MDTLPLPNVPKLKLLDHVRQVVRRRGYAQATADAYCHWIKRFVLFHGKRHPRDMGVAEVEQFLSHLTEQEHVSASTQNQALSGLLFLYKRVLLMPLDQRIEASRAKRYKHLLVVLSVGEIGQLLAAMQGTQQLMAQLTYGSGLRLMEVHRIRVGHLDFDHNRLHVLDSKGRKDRITLLPRGLHAALRAQMARVAQLHVVDLAKGLGSAVLPFAFFRKSSEASRQLRWQFLFPSGTTFNDTKTGNSGRWHVNETGLSSAVRKAAEAAQLNKRVTVHTLRHSFATHMLQDGCDIRTLQMLLGHSQVNTTMLYAHINDNFCLTTRSPLDCHLQAHLAPGPSAFIPPPWGAGPMQPRPTAPSHVAAAAWG